MGNNTKENPHRGSRNVDDLVRIATTPIPELRKEGWKFFTVGEDLRGGYNLVPLSAEDSEPERREEKGYAPDYQI